jgi:hypothetical protein
MTGLKLKTVRAGVRSNLYHLKSSSHKWQYSLRTAAVYCMYWSLVDASTPKSASISSSQAGLPDKIKPPPTGVPDKQQWNQIAGTIFRAGTQVFVCWFNCVTWGPWGTGPLRYYWSNMQSIQFKHLSPSLRTRVNPQAQGPWVTGPLRYRLRDQD